MIDRAILRLIPRASTCASSQQTSVLFHVLPQRATNFSLRVSNRAPASPLSTQGTDLPKKALVHSPRMAPLPDPCRGVVGASAARTEGKRRAIETARYWRRSRIVAVVPERESI